MLVQVLAPDSARDCWFGVWTGFGWMRDPPPAPRLALPERPLLLYSGPG